MARSKANSGKKRQSPKSTAAPPGIDGAERSPGDESQGASGRAIWIAVSAVAAIVVAVGIGFYLFTVSGSDWNAREAAAATFVGSETCAGCHQAEAKLWHGSHHEQAMDHATEKSVRGDFNDASFDYHGLRSRFFRKDGKFLVETDGPDGKLAAFDVKYTFGVYPLQQYLVEFADGRIQALSIGWDSRPKEQGGQRWFQLYQSSAQTFHNNLIRFRRP